MLKLSALVRLLKPCSLRRGSGLTTAVVSLAGGETRHYGANPLTKVCPGRADVCPAARMQLPFGIATASSMNARKPADVSPVRFASSPLSLDQAATERFLAHCQRRRYPNRTDVFRPGDPAGTLYYVAAGSVSIIAEEEDGRELVLGYYGAGEFVGEMGLFIESDSREVILRTRSACELAEIGYERLQQLMLGPLAADAPRLLYSIGVQLSRRLLTTSRKA